MVQPFLLDIQHRNNGTTALIVDTGVTSRTNLVTLTETAHVTMATDLNAVLGYMTGGVKPPVQSRRR